MTPDRRDGGRAATVAVDLWLAPLADRLPDDQAALCRSIMSLEERNAADRFHGESRREQALVARALLRRALTHRLGRPPEQWVFETQDCGRPCLAKGQTPRLVDFNLAHTKGYVICAIAENAAVGVDVEALTRAGELRQVAARFLAQAESLELTRLAPDLQAARIVQLWTLKEAYAKALGTGLTMPFTQVIFSLFEDRETPSIRCESAPGWQFHVLSAPQGFALALAVQAPREMTRLMRRDGLELLFGASTQGLHP